MQKYKLINNFFNKEIVFFSFFYLSLILGFLLSENSTGGALIDYNNQKNIAINFANNFKDTLLNYDNYSTRHSPILIILLSFLEKINLPDSYIRLVHLHICLFLPFIFYKIINEQIESSSKRIALILTGLIFLSPTFRSLSIWPDSRLIGLSFFSLSIFYYLKFCKGKQFKFAILNVFSCALSAYFSPNFSVFALFFLINYISIFGIKNKKLFIIIITNLLIAIPAIYYVFILEVNFLTKTAAIGGLAEKGHNIFFINISNDILITFTIVFFYLIPFLFTKIIKIENILKYENILFSLLICIILSINFNYNYNLSGGGIFFKISHYLFSNNYLFFLLSFISIVFIFPLLRENKTNIIIFALIILNNPQYTIYHKYFDPFLLIIFFSIFSLKRNYNLVLPIKNIFLLYSFFLSFLILSVYK